MKLIGDYTGVVGRTQVRGDARSQQRSAADEGRGGGNLLAAIGLELVEERGLLDVGECDGAPAPAAVVVGIDVHHLGRKDVVGVEVVVDRQPQPVSYTHLTLPT